MKPPSLWSETGTTGQVCAAMIRANVLMLPNGWIENSIVGVMFSLFLLCSIMRQSQLTQSAIGMLA